MNKYDKNGLLSKFALMTEKDMKKGCADRHMQLRKFHRYLLKLSLLTLSFAVVSCNESEHKNAYESLSTLVETIKVKKENKPIYLSAEGTVKPHRELEILSEVKGRIIEQSPNLDAGGILTEGEILLKLDPRDYVVDVEKNRANLEKAEYELILEKGKKIVAEKEWQLLDSSLKQGGLGKDLALRIPHLREKEAALHAAQSSLEKSLVDLKRTLIRAPFNSLVLEEFVEKGQLILPHTKIAKLVSTDQYRIQVSVPYDRLETLIPIIKNTDTKIPVNIIQDLGDDKIIEREGYVFRLKGGVDPNGRLVQVLVVVDDPLNLESSEPDQFPLLLGSKVKVQFGSIELSDVIQVPKTAIHEDDQVWLKDENNKLVFRKVHVLMEDGSTAYIDGKDFHDGEEIVTTNLPVVHPGMQIHSM